MHADIITEITNIWSRSLIHALSMCCNAIDRSDSRPFAFFFYLLLHLISCHHLPLRCCLSRNLSPTTSDIQFICSIVLIPCAESRHVGARHLPSHTIQWNGEIKLVLIGLLSHNSDGMGGIGHGKCANTRVHSGCNVWIRRRSRSLFLPSFHRKFCLCKSTKLLDGVDQNLFDHSQWFKIF